MVTSVGSSHFDEKMPNEYVEALYVAFSGGVSEFAGLCADASKHAIANTPAVIVVFIFLLPSETSLAMCPRQLATSDQQLHCCV